MTVPGDPGPAPSQPSMADVMAALTSMRAENAAVLDRMASLERSLDVSGASSGGGGAVGGPLAASSPRPAPPPPRSSGLPSSASFRSVDYRVADGLVPAVLSMAGSPEEEQQRLRRLPYQQQRHH